MIRTGTAVIAAMLWLAGMAFVQQQRAPAATPASAPATPSADFSKVEIKTTDLAPELMR